MHTFTVHRFSTFIYIVYILCMCSSAHVSLLLWFYYRMSFVFYFVNYTHKLRKQFSNINCEMKSIRKNLKSKQKFSETKNCFDCMCVFAKKNSKSQLVILKYKRIALFVSLLFNYQKRLPLFSIASAHIHKHRIELYNGNK